MIGEELFLSVGGQALLLLRAVCAGFSLGACYECLRVPRRLLQSPACVVAAGDVGYAAFSTLVCFRVLLASCGGRLRFFLLLGIAGGAAVYFCTVGRLVTQFSKRVQRRALCLRRKANTASQKAAQRMYDSGVCAASAACERGKEFFCAAVRMKRHYLPFMHKNHRQFRKKEAHNMNSPLETDS